MDWRAVVVVWWLEERLALRTDFRGALHLKDVDALGDGGAGVVDDVQHGLEGVGVLAEVVWESCAEESGACAAAAGWRSQAVGWGMAYLELDHLGELQEGPVVLVVDVFKPSVPLAALSALAEVRSWRC